MMNAQEIETAVRLKANAVNMVWSDGTLGLIEWKQENKFGHPFGTRFENPDWIKLAESLGAIGMELKKGERLTALLEEAFACDRPVILNVPVDYTENIKLTERLGALVCPV